MPIDPQEMKRLALIRFLYTEGLEQVARPAPCPRGRFCRSTTQWRCSCS
jgi:hypothetical protein